MNKKHWNIIDMMEMNVENQQNCLQLVVPFGFFTDWVKAKTKHEVKMSFVDEKTVALGSVFKMMLPIVNKEVSKEISIKISDIQLIGEKLQMHYDAGLMINLLSTFLKKILPSSVIENKVVDLPDNSTSFFVHLDKVEKAKQVLQHIDFQGIHFRDTAAVLDFKLRR